MKNSNTTPSANMAHALSGPTTTLSYSITPGVKSRSTTQFSIPGKQEIGLTPHPAIFKSMLVPQAPSGTLPITARSEPGFHHIVPILVLWMIGHRIFRSCLNVWDSDTSPKRSTTTTSKTLPTSLPEKAVQFSVYLDTLKTASSPRPSVFRFKRSSSSGCRPITRSYTITPPRK